MRRCYTFIIEDEKTIEFENFTINSFTLPYFYCDYVHLYDNSYYYNLGWF